MIARFIILLYFSWYYAFMYNIFFGNIIVNFTEKKY